MQPCSSSFEHMEMHRPICPQQVVYLPTTTASCVALSPDNGQDWWNGGEDAHQAPVLLVTIGVQACPDQLLTGYDYGIKVCHVLLVMDF